MQKKKSDKKHQFHPVYGYATKEEFDRLKKMGVCPEYYDLLKKINKRKGK